MRPRRIPPRLELVLVLAAAIASGTQSTAESRTQVASAPADAPGANVVLHRCTLQRIATPQQSSCQSVSYTSIAGTERATLDQALVLTLGDNRAARAACQLSGQGWTCVGDDWVCGCTHLPTGPVCACSRT